MLHNQKKSFIKILPNHELYRSLLYIILSYASPSRTSGLGVGSWPSNRATEGSNPKGTRLYFVVLPKNVEQNLLLALI